MTDRSGHGTLLRPVHKFLEGVCGWYLDKLGRLLVERPTVQEYNLAEQSALEGGLQRY